MGNRGVRSPIALTTACLLAAATTTAAVAAKAAPPGCDGHRATIVGTEGPDRLIGTPKRDVIAGLGGEDTVRGGRGGDVICGGEGPDALRGGRGADRIFGGKNGGDDLNGDAGSDLLKSGRINYQGDRNRRSNRLDGGPGYDQVRGRWGYDWIDYSTSNERIVYGYGKNSTDDVRNVTTVVGSRFNDKIRMGTYGVAFGLGGSDRLRGGTRLIDFIPAHPRIDGTLIVPAGKLGKDGSDRLESDANGGGLVGLRGRDTLIGGPGSDTVTARDGGDVLRGRGGARDRLAIEGLRGKMRLRLGGHTMPTPKPSRFSGFEYYTLDARRGLVIGSSRGETVWLSRIKNHVRVEGRGGNDHLMSAHSARGGAGNDEVSVRAVGRGGPGDDHILDSKRGLGGGGDDWIDASRSGQGGRGDDELIVMPGTHQRGGAGNDKLGYAIDRKQASRVAGGPGADLLRFLGYLSAPVDRSRIDLASGAAHIVFIPFGGGKPRTHDGKVIGIERVRGSRGDDRLLGTRGANTLLGRKGDDTVDGRRGTDTCEAETVRNCEK